MFQYRKRRMQAIAGWLKNRRKRLLLSAAAGLLAVAVAGAPPIAAIKEKMSMSGVGVSAWWGTLYPKFCFSEGTDENAKDQKGDIAGNTGKTLKISFWLAKAMDW